MATFACLKYGFGDSGSYIISIDGYDFNDFINYNPNIDLDDLVSVLLLEQFFVVLGGGWSSYFPNLPILPQELAAYVGVLHDKSSLQGAEDKVMALAFSTENLLSILNAQIANVAPEVAESLIGGSIEDYNTALGQMGFPLSVSSTGGLDFRIFRCTPEELTNLGTANGGIYTDFFQFLKNSLSNTTPVLEAQGYEKAKYVADGDYISFKVEAILGAAAPPVGNDSGMVFSTANYAVGENKDYPISIYASGVSGDWSLTSNGVPLADYTGYASSEVSLNISPDGQDVFIELLGSSSGSRRYGLIIDADEVFFEPINFDEPTGIAKGEFVLYDWSTSIRGYYFRMPDTVIEVPNYLPEQVTSTAFMFEDSNLFNSDISNWDMSRITEVTGMFRYAKTFNSNISNWQVGQVEQFFGMFDGALDFNQNLSNWDVRSATYFSSEFNTTSGLDMMFNDATSFNQDLSSWCVSNQLTAPRDFDSGAVNWSLPKPIWGTCPSNV